MKMDAIEFDPNNGKLKIVHREVPECIDDDKVLIKVCFAGICGTDLHIIDVSITIIGGN